MSSVRRRNQVALKGLQSKVRRIASLMLEEAAKDAFTELVKGTVHDSGNAAFHWTSSLHQDYSGFSLKYGMPPVGPRHAGVKNTGPVLSVQKDSMAAASKVVAKHLLTKVTLYNEVSEFNRTYAYNAVISAQTISKAKQVVEERHRSGIYLETAIDRVRKEKF